MIWLATDSSQLGLEKYDLTQVHKKVLKFFVSFHKDGITQADIWKKLDKTNSSLTISNSKVSKKDRYDRSRIYQITSDLEEKDLVEEKRGCWPKKFVPTSYAKKLVREIALGTPPKEAMRGFLLRCITLRLVFGC